MANGGDERMAFIACLQCVLEQQIKPLERVNGIIRHELKLSNALWVAINNWNADIRLKFNFSVYNLIYL